LKILFTADWHIKLGQKNVPVEWAKKRFDSMIRQISNLAVSEKVDYLIVGGDVFDKVPTIEELEIFFDFVMRVRGPTIIYSGNHEALKKNTTFMTNLREVVYNLNNFVQIIDNFKTIDGIDFIPYNKLKEYHPADIDFDSRILCTHVRGEIPPHVKPEVPLELFERWDVVLAGDLHSYENCQRNILYPGSPVTTSFHRSKVSTGVILLDTDTLKHEFVELKLPQLLKKTLKAGEKPIATDYDHTIYDIEGDMADLASIQDSELIDKKISVREQDTALILDSAMTIETEVAEYLRYILNLSEENIQAVLKELEAYAAEINSL
jgi:DNA repair exonuclease SbcCD nuclease subunit